MIDIDMLQIWNGNTDLFTNTNKIHGHCLLCKYKCYEYLAASEIQNIFMQNSFSVNIEMWTTRNGFLFRLLVSVLVNRGRASGRLVIKAFGMRWKIL